MTDSMPVPSTNLVPGGRAQGSGTAARHCAHRSPWSNCLNFSHKGRQNRRTSLCAQVPVATYLSMGRSTAATHCVLRSPQRTVTLGAEGNTSAKLPVCRSGNVS
jgi:hypothetical protein